MLEKPGNLQATARDLGNISLSGGTGNAVVAESCFSCARVARGPWGGGKAQRGSSASTSKDTFDEYTSRLWHRVDLIRHTAYALPKGSTLNGYPSPPRKRGK